MESKSVSTVSLLENAQNGVPSENTKIDKNKFVKQEEVKKEAPKKTPLLCSNRLSLCLISFLGFVNLYSQRFNLSVTMVCMVNYTALAELRTMESVKTPSNVTTFNAVEGNLTVSFLEHAKHKDGEFAWPKPFQGLLLGSFFWGYITTQLAGGWLSERFGGKRVIGWCMLASSVVTLVMPFAARVDYWALFVLRVITGVCQGVVWPSMAVIWARWAPPSERQKLSGPSFAGSHIGPVVTFPIAAVLCDHGFDGGWPSAFYIIGIIGIVWCLAWSYIVYDTPDEHPRISVAEREYICSSLKGKLSLTLETRRSAPWKSLLSSKKVWAIVAAYTCSNWGTYVLLTSMPTYMSDVLHFDHQQNGLYSALPYVGFFIGTNVSAIMYDAVTSRKICTRTVARKIGNTLGMLCPCLLIIGVSFMDCTNPIGAVTLLVACVTMGGFQFGAGYLTNVADVAPQYAGVVFGFANTIATIPGIVGPTVTGYITTDHLQSQWQVVFFIAAGFYAFGAVVYIIFGSAVIEEWAREPLVIEGEHNGPSPSQQCETKP